MFNVYVYGSVQKVRERLRACPRRIVIITSLKITICWMNNSTQLVTVYCRQTDVIFQKISFSGTQSMVTRTHTHFMMTGIRGSHDGNGSRLNIHIEHSLSVFYDYGLSRLSGVGGRTWCQPRVWSKPRVTKRCTGRFFSFLKLPPLRIQAFHFLQPGSTVQ